MSLPITPSKEVFRDISNKANIISLSDSNAGVYRIKEIIQLGYGFKSKVSPWWVIVVREILTARNCTCRVVSNTTGKAVLMTTEKLRKLVWERSIGGLGGDIFPPGDELGVCVCGNIG